MPSINQLLGLPVKSLALLLLSCSVYLPLEDTIPGTDLCITNLVSEAVIFPYFGKTYTLPSFLASGTTVTISGTPAFSVEFIAFTALGNVTLFSVTWSGAATGKRYTGTSNAVLNSFGAGTASTYFPGNSNGTVATGAQQI